MILITGKSATGKTLLANNLTKYYGIKKVITATTRAKRVDEIDGIHYYFYSKEEFISQKEKGNFVETTLYNDNFYGCPKKELGKNKVIVVDPIGVSNFLKLNDKSIVTFLLTSSKESRIARMKMRGDLNEQIKKRIENDEKDFAFKNLKNIDFIIDSDNRSPEEIVKEVYDLYQKKLAS